jgi:hypothetical protein
VTLCASYMSVALGSSGVRLCQRWRHAEFGNMLDDFNPSDHIVHTNITCTPVLLPSTVCVCTVCFVTARIRSLLFFTFTTTPHVMRTHIDRYLCQRRVRVNLIWCAPCRPSSLINAHDHSYRKVWRGEERIAQRLPGRLKKKGRRFEHSGSTTNSSISSSDFRWTPLHAHAHIKPKTVNINIAGLFGTPLIHTTIKL